MLFVVKFTVGTIPLFRKVHELKKVKNLLIQF